MFSDMIENELENGYFIANILEKQCASVMS
jgi:hypothetical protein